MTSQLLAVLLEAERIARGLSGSDLRERLARGRQFNLRRAAYFQALLDATESPTWPGTAGEAAFGGSVADKLRGLGLDQPSLAGPVLLVCEGRPFCPDLDSPIDQLLIRLLGGLGGLGIDAQVLRLPRRSKRVLQWLLGKLPALDAKGRPLFAYGMNIHDNCPRRAHYEAGEFVKKFGDEGAMKGWCLAEVGCKGPNTFNNCPQVMFNDGTNWPIGAGHPCIGCSEPNFWDEQSPFYQPI